MTTTLPPPSSSRPRPRVLFVDDEPAVLEGLSASLRRLKNTWTMRFECGGQAALDALASGRFDAIVTDMRMPKVDGEAVLLSAREHSPGAVRLILSGQTDFPVVRRTLKIAHQFIPKPCRADELRGCLDTMIRLTATMDDRTRDIVCAVGELPISPVSSLRLKELFATPALAASDVVACVERDSALAAKVLHVASAGFFASRQAVTSVGRAVAVLGVETIRAMTLSMDVRQEEGSGMRRPSRRPSAAPGPSGPEEHVLLDGVLYGLGKVVLLAHFGVRYAELLARVAASPGLRLEVLEGELFGVDHDEVGRRVAALWGICPPHGDSRADLEPLSARG
jgi:DNA-binding NarL/FixJ family response regulator